MAVFSVDLAGVSLQCSVRFPETKVYFQSWLSPDRSAAEPPESGGYTIPDADWDSFPGINMPQCPHTEYSMLVGYLSDRLIEEDRCAIHAVAIRWNGAAYLICGESGVGKSTQTKWLHALRPGEFSVICGDRPILQFCGSDNHENSELRDCCMKNAATLAQYHGKEAVPKNEPIIVHPSPWNGKENWYGAAAAPLGGIILLVRGETNAITPLSTRQAVVPLYKAFIHSGRDAEKIKRIAYFEEIILNHVNIWMLTSSEVPQSTELLLKTVFPKLIMSGDAYEKI